PALRVTVRRADGRPLPAATVTLLDSAGRQLSRAESDGNGVSEFLSASGGEFLLVVRHEGYLPQARTVLLQQQPAPTVEVEVLVPGAARLSGVVTNATGRPVEGALVTLTGVDGAVAASTRTDAEGAYDLVDLTVEDGTLAVFAPSGRPIAIPVTIPPGGKVRQDVEVRGSGVVSGTAQTPEGWLIADARVSLHADGVEVAVTRTDADGAYSFPGLDTGNYTVVAVGYPPSQTEVVAGNGETTAEPLTLAHDD
ncbi:collagen binding domain-containing protein, partial [Sporichthya sp.]|uniref:MSCRAMM family protein n=1 Tax=Sporichthya sp. TaxID=65475 RepID=UPI00182DF45C